MKVYPISFIQEYDEEILLGIFTKEERVKDLCNKLNKDYRQQPKPYSYIEVTLDDEGIIDLYRL